jgi:hypothetical protein
MDGAWIWLSCVVAAAIYGIAHDSVTARLCVEYFTVYHPPLVHTDNPTLLALYWGIAATWWMGAILGIPVSLAARAGRRPQLDWRDMLRPLAVLLLVMAVAALVAGLVGYAATPVDWIDLTGEQAHRFTADYYAHSASYLVGAVGALGVCAWALIIRSRRARANG